jgi:aldehyde dehydrogenase (NAD+)
MSDDMPSPSQSASEKVVMQSYQMLIGGVWVDASSGDRMDSINPYTAQPWASVPRATNDDVDAAVAAAQAAFADSPWRTMTPTARGQLLNRLADLIATKADQLAEIECTDIGKLMIEATAQFAVIPQWYRYYAGLADKVEGIVVPSPRPGVLNYTRREPLGVVAAITPWNSPLMLATWKLAPALAAGNTVVWKPSEFSSVSSLVFAELFEEAGFPAGVVNVVTGDGAAVGERLVSHPDVAKVAFTGGDATGQAVYERAAAGIKPVTLELGGKSAQIVFDDANVDNAIKGVVSGIFAAAGQTCIAGSRALVHRGIYNEFIDKVVEFARSAQMGDPRDAATQLGPITTQPQLEKVLHYIKVATDDGARCVLGGQRAARPECGTGWFVEPTVFADVRPQMRIAREEVFGPVLSVIVFDDDDEAVAIANDTIFGLAAGVWTTSMRRAISTADRLQAGTVWVNTYRAVSHMSPFGGYKRSGIGRENGQESMNEYLQTKSVWIETSDDVPNPFVMR